MTKSKISKQTDDQSPGKGLQGSGNRPLTPFEEMDRMFEEFFGRPWPRGFMQPRQWDWPAWNVPSPFEGRVPKVDVINRDDEVVVKAELPGVKKEDLDVSLSENSLTIKASTRHEEKEEKGEYHRTEISRGEFSRTVVLPADVDGSQAKANFKDGILELTLPKLAPAKRHKVKID